MIGFEKLMASEPQFTGQFLEKYKIKTIENVPPGNNNSSVRKRIIFMRENEVNDLEII